jgi:multidrug resistance efflux pump
VRRPGCGPVPAELAALEARVEGLERGVESIAREIKNLAVRIDERGRTPWALIWSGLGVAASLVGLVGALVLRPIDEAQARLDRVQAAFAAELVPRREHQERWRQEERAIERLESRLDRLERAESRL